MALLRKLLFPVSLVYALVVYLRNYLYDVGFFTSKSFRTPTICIGNLSVGGTGKTPMAEFLISVLQPDYKVAVLSRGYRRESTGFVLANERSTVGELGDEPFQIYRKFAGQGDIRNPGITIAVDVDRRNGIQILEEKVAPEIILLDDAFQHRQVKYGLSILLTSYGNLYCDDWYLPTGNLRDSKREARRADVIVVTKCPSDISDSERERIARKLNPNPNQSLLFSTLAYGIPRKGTEDDDTSVVPSASQDASSSPSSSLPKVSPAPENTSPPEARPESIAVGSSATSSENNSALDKLKEKNITLVTGIADPAPLVAYLNKAGLIFEHLRFKDHHIFTKGELAEIRKRELILTTEKDYMRLWGKVENLYYLPIEHRFLNDDRTILNDHLRRLMKRKS